MIHFVKGKGFYYRTNATMPSGKIVSVSGRWFGTKAEAKADCETKIAKAIEEDSIGKSDKPFREFFDEFEQYKLNTKVCSSTATTLYDYVYPMYFKGYFDGKGIGDALSNDNVMAWYRYLMSMGKSNARKNKVIALFKDINKYAYENLLIDPKTFQLNDVRVYKLKIEKENAPKERASWDEEDAAKFLSAIPDKSFDWYLFRLYLSTAPRIGEFQALTPNDFDFKKQTVTISKQWEIEGSKGPIVTTRLKSRNSYRTIPLTKEICDMVQEFIALRGIGGNDFLFGPLFCDPTKVPISRNYIRTHMDKWAKKAGIEHTCPHSFRHLLVTKLLSNCTTIAEVKSVANIVGHDATTDLNIYAHAREDLAREIVNKANKA